MKQLAAGLMLVALLGGCAEVKKVWDKVTTPDTPTPAQPTEPKP